jgi:hypothetical protein
MQDSAARHLFAFAVTVGLVMVAAGGTSASVLPFRGTFVVTVPSFGLGPASLTGSGTAVANGSLGTAFGDCGSIVALQHGPASGDASSAAQGSGVVQLVSPLAINTSIPASSSCRALAY